MAEMVSSAVVQETVSHILSGLVHKSEGEEKPNANQYVERLEMAHIKLEAALEISNKWLITDASLLRWRKRLKRAVQECDDTLHKWKQGMIEREQMEQEVRSSSFPKRIAHATKSFIFSSSSHKNNEWTRSTVERFEWFADGASEFLRFVELGGTPRCHMAFNSIVKHLLAGKELQHKIVWGDECPSILLWLVPFSTEEHGIEACLKLIQIDSNKPENNFFLGVMLQVSESTDIVGIIVKCLQLFPLHFQPITETIKKEITQLPTQDFSWVPYVDLWHRKHWDYLHSFSTQWFRPDPLCCKHHDQHKLCRISDLGMVGLPDVPLDSVIEINLQCQVSLSEYNKQHTSLSKCIYSTQGSPYLKVGLLFTPHGSSNSMFPADKSSATATIYGEEQEWVHTDITLEQLNATMLPKAMDYFCQNTEASVYRMLWKSEHGIEYIDVEKASMEIPSAQRPSRGTKNRKGRSAKKRKVMGRQVRELGSRNHMVARFLTSWVSHAPVRLQGSVLDWIQKEKESQLLAPPLHLKFM